MQHIFKKTLLVSALTLAIAPAAYATNGIEATGLGMVHKAMGGAAVANPQNTMSMATNPASINNVPSGLDVGIELFNPKKKGTQKAAFGGATFDGNGRDYFLIPESGYKMKPRGGNKSFGVAVYGAGGMNTKYSGSNPPLLNGNPFNAGGTGESPSINLEQLVIAPTIGIKINKKHSIGIAANLVHQRFKAQGLDFFKNPAFTTDPTAVSGRGVDSSSGIGLTVGWQGQLTDKVMAGAVYRSKVDMGKMKKYAGLLTNGGDLDMPAAVSIGLGIKASPKTTIAMDVKHVFYSDVAGTGNSPNIIPGSRQVGGDVGFGWEDQTVYKIGVKHQLNPKLALMAGLNHGKNPISAEGTNLNLLAPGITENHLSLGFEKKLNKHSSISAAYIRTFSTTLKGDAMTAPIPQQYDLEMNQHALGIAYSKQF